MNIELSDNAKAFFEQSDKEIIEKFGIDVQYSNPTEYAGFLLLDTDDGVDKKYDAKGNLVEVWSQNQNEDGRV